ncbi:protein of unknown function [Aminobacter niigataensis]|nr:protein of unknown function [Aminobacter niigataensis]
MSMSPKRADACGMQWTELLADPDEIDGFAHGALHLLVGVKLAELEGLHEYELFRRPPAHAVGCILAGNSAARQ